MKFYTLAIAILFAIAPTLASAASATCHGQNGSLTLNSSGNIMGAGATVVANFADRDPTFTQSASIACQIETTSSGTYCVDDQDGVNWVIDLSHAASGKIELVEQDHGGYGSESFTFLFNCTFR